MTRGSTATVPTWEEENNNALRSATNLKTNHFKNKQIGTMALSTAATESAHLTTCLIYFQMSNQVGPVGAVVPDKRQGASLGSGVNRRSADHWRGLTAKSQTSETRTAKPI